MKKGEKSPKIMNYQPPGSSNEPKLNDRRAKEKLIIDRALKGDENAFSEIISLYKGKVAATVYSILGREYVEEISHETFIRAFNSIKRYRSDSSFYTYLIRIAVNLCRDEIRRKKIRKNLQLHGNIQQNRRRRFNGKVESVSWARKCEIQRVNRPCKCF